MTQAYFESQTGFFPSSDLWVAIEGYYKSHRGQYASPAHFCWEYRKDPRLASDLQTAATIGANVRVMLAGVT